jgi:hypothetical protein
MQQQNNGSYTEEDGIGDMGPSPMPQSFIRTHQLVKGMGWIGGQSTTHTPDPSACTQFGHQARRLSDRWWRVPCPTVFFQVYSVARAIVGQSAKKLDRG